MCHSPASRPPFLPVSGGAAAIGERVVLTSQDEARFAAYSVSAVGESESPGVVLLPDVRGLHAFYEDLALRMADAGITTIAMDYFGRTVGTEPRGDDFDFMSHVPKIRPEEVGMDVATCIAHLRSGPLGNGPVFTMGFCMGGRASFNQAARGHGLAGVIGFYGRPAKRDISDPDAPIDRVAEFECPVLGLFGGADPGIPSEDIKAFEKTLDAHGIRNELVIYDGAPHSFFDRAFDQHKEACEDAWRRVLRFVTGQA